MSNGDSFKPNRFTGRFNSMARIQRDRAEKAESELEDLTEYLGRIVRDADRLCYCLVHDEVNELDTASERALSTLQDTLVDGFLCLLESERL